MLSPLHRHRQTQVKALVIYVIFSFLKLSFFFSFLFFYFFFKFPFKASLWYWLVSEETSIFFFFTWEFIIWYTIFLFVKDLFSCSCQIPYFCGFYNRLKILLCIFFRLPLVQSAVTSMNLYLEASLVLVQKKSGQLHIHLFIECPCTFLSYNAYSIFHLPKFNRYPIFFSD